MPEMFTACTKKASCIRTLTENACADAVKDMPGRDPGPKEVIYSEAKCKAVHQFLMRLLEHQSFSSPSILSITSHTIRGDMLRSHRESAKGKMGKGPTSYFDGAGCHFHEEIKAPEHQYENLNVRSVEISGTKRGFKRILM